MNALRASVSIVVLSALTAQVFAAGKSEIVTRPLDAAAASRALSKVSLLKNVPDIELDTIVGHLPRLPSHVPGLYRDDIVGPLLRVNIQEQKSVGAETEAHGAFPASLVLLIALYVILVNSAFASCESFCSAYMDTELKLSTAFIGFLTAIGQFITILAPVAMPWLGVRRSHAWTLMTVGILTAAVMIPLSMIPTWQVAGK